jgi:hypothetical protein
MDVTSKPDVLLFTQFSTIVEIFAPPIALLVSLVLLRIYRRAVMRTMQRRVTLEAGGVLEDGPAQSGEPPGHSLQIMPHDAPADGIRLAVRRAKWPYAGVEVCAGLAYAMVMTASWLAVGHIGFKWSGFLLSLIIFFAWPLVITIGLTTAVSWRELAILLAGYVLVFAVFWGPFLVSAGDTKQVLTLWFNINGLGTVLAVAFLARPIRAVGSMVLVFMIAVLGGVIPLIFYFNQHHQAVGAVQASLAVVLAIVVIGWLLLRWPPLTNWLNASAIGRLRALTVAWPIKAVVVACMIVAIANAIVLTLWDSDKHQSLVWALDNKLVAWSGVLLQLIVAAVPTGMIGWLLLRWLGSLYRRRRISDQSIITDAIWLMFSFVHSPTYVGSVSGSSELSFAIAIGAFVAYKLAATAGFRLLRTGAESDEQAPKLLLLRVFSLGTRSERLFASFTKLWRYTGSVRMIAGPDLATSTVEPHEFLDFVAGRLQRRFITGPDTLEQRISETEQRRDVDGRFRVADFFCHDDTWQMVLRRLAKDSDVVLMDLRGFSQSNRGCVFEINELLHVMLLRHIVFVVDRTTDENFLAQVFASAWTIVTKASPNWKDPAPRIRLYRFDGHVGPNIPALVAVVANAGMHYPMRNKPAETR